MHSTRIFHVAADRLRIFSISVACLSLVHCGRTETTASGTRNAGGDWFVDATAQTGLTFTHVNGMTGQFFYPEIIAPGVALLDYDNDGDLDVFLVQGGSLDAKTGAGAGPAAGGRLFRNDLDARTGGSRDVRFTDVTDASGIRTGGYGMGAAVGDYDNDGCVDLYVTALGRNQLFRNRCDGTFEERGAAAGVNDPGWSVSAAFVDYDRDGWLDLYVGHHLAWTPSLNTPCYGPSGRRVYCAPKVYTPQPGRLYHNNRDGTFSDVTVASGMAGRFGPALGVTTADFNGDGWIDMYVANDGQENQLWLNQRNGTFKEMGLLSGAAVSERGRAKAGMGVDAGDFDDDGDEDLFVTNLSGEGHDLYVNDGSGAFESRSAPAGLTFPTLPFTGFGTAWLDADNDGWLDLLTVNGTIQRIDALARSGDPHPLRQRKQLFRNLGNGRFAEVGATAGGAFQRLDVGRGAAFGDLDNDGDTDVIVGNNNGAAQVLLNTIGARNHWIGLRLAGGVPGKGAVRDMLGARVAILRNGSPARWRRAHADGSFASANDSRVLVGLGSASAGERPRVRVTWPDGTVEEWHDVQIDRYTTLVAGSSR
jgi:enediyne biosynthesis protein E4